MIRSTTHFEPIGDLTPFIGNLPHSVCRKPCVPDISRADLHETLIRYSDLLYLLEDCQSELRMKVGMLFPENAALLGEKLTEIYKNRVINPEVIQSRKNLLGIVLLKNVPGLLVYPQNEALVTSAHNKELINLLQNCPINSLDNKIRLTDHKNSKSYLIKISKLPEAVFWGTRLSFNDEEFGSAVKQAILNKVRSEVEANLYSMRDIISENRINSRSIKEMRRWTAQTYKGYSLEVLIKDVLNEKSQTAVMARVSRNLWSDTDIVFQDKSIPMDFSNSIQVGVSLKPRPDYSRMLDKKGIIYVSPYTLAKDAIENGLFHLIPHEIEKIERKIERTVALARVFDENFTRAFSNPHLSGSAYSLSHALKAHIRQFVHDRAF